MKRIATGLALIFLTFGPGAVQAAETAPPSAEAALQGVVGVCVRWGASSSHLSDVVVVKPSGNALLDAAIPETLKGLDWPSPQGDTGGWTALSVGVGGVEPTGEAPSCDGLASVATTPAPASPEFERAIPVKFVPV